MKWKLIMNTINKTKTHVVIKPNSPMQSVLRKLTFFMVSAAIFSTFYVATGSNANAFANESELLSSRSSPVNYEGKMPKQGARRNAQDTNEAQQAAILSVNQLSLNEGQRKTREHVMLERSDKLRDKDGSSATLSSQSVQSGNYVEFDIYDASSRLFEDFDYDGFYQTFSVTFDADVYGQYSGESAHVFADLYLSRDGGPWELYFTTDVFTIVDDISEDEFEVVTTLDVGYRTDHYDVLIDLYQVGYSEPVATISSEDVDDLYALPLESSDRDEYVVVETYESEVLIGGGSMSIYGLVILFFTVGLRFGNYCKNNK